MSRKKLSLGERIALAASGGQQDDNFPEDIEYDTAAKVIEVDEDHDNLRPVGRSSLRAKNVQLLDEFDERYSGEKVSRKKLAGGGDSDEEEDDDQEEGGESLDEVDSEEEGGLMDLKEEDDSESGEEEEEEDDDGSEEGSEEEVDDQEESDEEEETGTPAMQTLSLRDKQTEIEKGRATLNQLRIWDSLLEVRIRLQKMLLDCNRLPHPELYEELVSDLVASNEGSQLAKVIEKSQDATKTLMYELLRLQEIMTEKNAETKKALSKPTSSTPNLEADDPMNEEITSESSDDDDQGSPSKPPKLPSPPKRKSIVNPAETAKKMKLSDFSTSAASSFTSLIPYRHQTIQKWNDKTQFAGGKFNKKSASQQISTLRQIEQILSNKDRLLKRTQVKRSSYSIIGEPVVPSSSENEGVPPEPHPEIFDDDDFYHQLLRELIERKTSNVNDPLQLSHHWLELQKLRTKLKKKVDTKASKGRKIRYDVHAKLVNFMAPQENCKMSGAAVKELFGSLFGKTRQSE